jgi:hypothetical protein
LRGYPSAVAQVKAKTGGNDHQHCGRRRNPDQASREERGLRSAGSRGLRRSNLRRLSGGSLPRSAGIASFASLACQGCGPQCRDRKSDLAILYRTTDLPAGIPSCQVSQGVLMCAVAFQGYLSWNALRGTSRTALP